MYPFSAQTWRILLLFVLSLCYYLLLPKIFPPIFQAMVYGVGLVVLYVFSTRILKLDADVVHSVENFYRKAQDKLREKRSSR
jgi:hypothetical protein